MKKACDLHTHSIYSDGTFTPSQIINEAIKIGLSAVALTDHNTVDGLTDFIEAAKGKDIEIVPGAEFSVDYNGKELHVLGLFIPEEKFSEVSALMLDVNSRKEASNVSLIESLARAGYPLDYEAIKASTPNGKVNRAHVAIALTQKGYTSSKDEAFATLLSPKAGHYKEPQRLTAFEIIDFIVSIGAVPVLAHPFLNLDKQELIGFLSEAKKHGLAGMECYYSTYDQENTDVSVRLAERFGIICSGGSDFHGATKPDISLGTGKGDLLVPTKCYLMLKNTIS